MPHDESDVMVLGALSCPGDRKKQINSEIRAIKEKHGIPSKVEVKWTKVSGSKIEMFEELIDYFFDNNDLTFRALVAKNKSRLDHKRYNDDDYDLWYYKMYYLLLDKFCYPNLKYRIFIDIKDTHGGARLRKLHDVLCNNKYDFKRDIILDIQQVSSDRNDLMQITDLLIGALSYYHRGLYEKTGKSIFKTRIIDKIMDYVGDDLIVGTGYSEKKFNIFIWTPRGGVGL